MDKYAGLASLFDPSVGSGSAELDRLMGIRPYSAKEREADRRRELADIETSMGGGEAGAMGGDGEQNLAYARRYLESRGVPAHIAAGSVGNFAQESGGIAGGALNKEGGLGIAQWRGERLYGGGAYEGLIPFAKRQGRSPQDLTTQLDYFISELQGPESGAFEKAMQTRTPEQAAVALGRYYERPNEQYANYGNRAAQARRFAAIPDEQIQNAPSGMYLDVTGGRPFQQRQAQQPQLETVPMQLSTGQTINVEKGMTHEEVASMLRKEGIEGAPLRSFQAPNGQAINVEYDMSDDEVLGMLRKEAPEYAVPQGAPAPDKSSYTAAAKEALLQGASGIATGLGGEIGELGKAAADTEFLGQYAQPIGEAITGAGESLRGYGEELGHRAEGVFEMPKDASWLEKNIAYPAVQTGAGIVPYAAAYAIPGVGPVAGTAALYGGAMGGLEERAKETGKEFVPSEARPYAVGETALDYVGGRLLGPLKKLFSDDVVLGAREAIVNAAEKGGIEEAKKLVGSRLGNIAKQVGITDAAFTSSEVAENVIERAYAGQELFDDAALEEYANTAKQVAGFGGLAGVAQGLGRHHIKATEVARMEEQKATDAAVEAQAEGQLANQEAIAEAAYLGAERKAERQPIEIPEELQGMPYEDAVRYMQMQEARARGPISEVEAPISPPTLEGAPSADISGEAVNQPPISPDLGGGIPPAPDLGVRAGEMAPETAQPAGAPIAPEAPIPEAPIPEAPIPEAPIPEAPIPEPTVQATPYYEQLGLKARKNSVIINGLKQLNPEDPTHGPTINAFLDEIETKKMPRDQQAIDALRTKISEVQQNAPLRQPNIIQEGPQEYPRGVAEGSRIPAETLSNGVEVVTQRVQDAARVFTEKGRNEAIKYLREAIPDETWRRSVLANFDANRETLRTSGDYGTVARQAIADIGTRTPQGRRWLEQFAGQLGTTIEQRAPERAPLPTAGAMGETAQPMQGVPNVGEETRGEGPVLPVLPTIKQVQTEARAYPDTNIPTEPSTARPISTNVPRAEISTSREGAAAAEIPYGRTESAEAPAVFTEETHQAGVAPYAIDFPQASAVRSDVSQFPGESQEIRYAPEGSTGMVEEGRIQRPAIKGYEGETTEKVKAVAVKNPDIGINPLPAAEFESATDAKDLLNRYTKVATDAQLHDLAKTYLTSPHIGSVKATFFKQGDKLPPNVQEAFDKEKAGAATVTSEKGIHLYFKTDDPDAFSEDNVIHEVTHAMTEAALARNPAVQGELASLSDKISRVLFSNDPSLGDFWDNVLRKNPGETLAYGLTSPTFRKILSKYDEDGHRLKAKPSEFRGKAPEKLSLWDKFVDAVAKLFGFPTQRKEQFKRELNEYLSKKTDYEKQLSDYNAQRPMQAKLDSILQELMKTTEAEGVAMPSETTVRAVTQEAPRRERGLAGKLKDKDFGEKLSEATRDILTSGRQTSLRSEWFDQSEALGKATENLPTMVGKKARVDFLASHVAQVGNVIADSIHNGFVKDVGDGSVMTIKDHNLAPEKIFRRVAETGKKELFNEMLVALRGRSIREADRKTKALADDLLTKADEMEEYASTLQDKKKQASFNRSAQNLRTIAEKKLEGINYDKGRTEVSEEDIRKAEELARAEPELAREAQNVYNLLKKSVDLLEDSGSIDAATAEQYREYQNYIPLYKEQDFEEAMIDPAKHLQLIISKMGRGANKLPEIKRQKAHFHEVMVESNILKHIAFCTMAAAKNNLNKAAALQMELVGAAEPSKLGKDDPDGVQFRDKGEVKYYTIKDKQALFALQAAQPLINPIFKQLKKVSGVVRGAMVMNPLFWYRQLVREPLTASLVGRTGMITPFDTLAEIAKIAAGKSKRYEDLKRRGVVAAQDVITDPIEFIKYVEKDRGWVSKGIERIKEIHEAVDGATRAVVAERAYQDAISKGYSEEDANNLAAIKAREIINFSKQGRSQLVRVMRATTPFFGAALNGLDILAKTAMPRKYGRLSKAEAMEARRMFYSRAAMVALYTTAYSMASSDDEDYLSTVDRADNWLVPIDNKDNPFAKIAINYEFGFFLKTFPELITLMNMGAISTKKAATEAGKSIWETVVPPMPTIYAIKPLVEAYINFDFHTQSPIETGSDSRGMSYLKNKKAGELTKAIAEKLHDAGIDLETLSPDRMEHVLNGYFGQIWAIARTASDYALYDGPEKPEKILSDYPLISGAVTKSARDAAVNDFYSVYGDVRALSESVSKAEKTGDIQLLEKLRKDKNYAKYMKADTPLGDKMQAMDNKQQIIARIEKDPTIDAAEKKRRIDIQNEQRNTLAKQGLDIARKLGLDF